MPKRMRRIRRKGAKLKKAKVRKEHRKQIVKQIVKRPAPAVKPVMPIPTAVEPTLEELARLEKPGKAARNLLDREFVFMLALFIVAIVAIGWIIMFVLGPPGEEVPAVGASNYTLPSNVTIDSRYIPGVLDPKACLARYGIASSVVVFIYAGDCPFSTAMQPIVRQLQDEGYVFYLANVANGSALQPVTNCLGDIAQMTSTPEFVCATNAQSRLGTLALEQLRGFAEDCRK